jgi:hypothetical protein
MRALFFVIVISAAYAESLSAQRTDSLSGITRDTGATSLRCDAYGASVRAWTRTPSSPADSSGVRRSARTAAQPFDTTYRLSIADRRWQQNDVSAGVAVGAAGRTKVANAPWSTCVGASVYLGQVTAVLHNVDGVVHLRADARRLEQIGNAASDLRPVVPPRR